MIIMAIPPNIPEVRAELNRQIEMSSLVDRTYPEPYAQLPYWEAESSRRVAEGKLAKMLEKVLAQASETETIPDAKPAVAA
jgi:hypothetical protein